MKTLSLAIAGAVVLTAGSAVAAPDGRDFALVNRITWGATPEAVAEASRMGADRWLEAQLHPSPDARLPAAVQAEIDAMPISATPMTKLVGDTFAMYNAAKQIKDPEAKRPVQLAYRQALNGLGQQAVERSLLLDLYSPNQLQERMTWFWFNHFNVDMRKRDIQAMVADYEDKAIRPRVFGRFRDLLEATLRHPAMLRYLDNDQNAAGHINENYAREIMELHTLGINGGYSQKDVQELARILTGVGVSLSPTPPNISPARRALYIREGLFEFNPNRHDFGDKMFLGKRITGRGFAEVEEALDLLARHPATARHISLQLATYFVGDSPPPALVERMARTFRATDGDIGAVLDTLFKSPEFTASLGAGFKDSLHYAVSAVRLACDGQTITNPLSLSHWTMRMGEGLFVHLTPDGYDLSKATWAGPGQMTTRFEIAKLIGSGANALFRPEGPAASPPTATCARPQDPTLDRRDAGLTIGAATRAALNQAATASERSSLFLASPEFMHD